MSDPTVKYHPSTMTNSISLKGREIKTGGNIIIPIDNKILATTISKIKNGLGLAIVSTSIGIMSDNDARMKNVGGEIICRVF